ncbi:MAG TPA: hypothetical protein VH396_10675 [Chitinophagaceae bacterium]|jgi:hypothetical protein
MMQTMKPTKLHTEMLEEKYGKIDVQILCDDDNLREVLLTDELHITRTYALTMKNKEWQQNEEICSVNRAIQNGEAIGKAFKSRGYEIQKNVLDVYITTLPYWLQLVFATESKRAKTRITEFIIKKHNEIYSYGLITEIYSPSFRKPVVNTADEMQINMPSPALLKLGFSKEEIWASLESKALAPDFTKLYSSVVAEVKEKVHNIIMDTLPMLLVN